jgi:radical SAM superfamily enzyme YgiQ (UPF0313 family)
MADIVLINPRFEISYWGLEYMMPLVGKRATMPVSSLPLIAALTPGEHQVTIIDENVEAIDFERAARADIVGVTGLSVQRFRMREILTELKERGAFTVVGGAWVTVQENYFGELADTIFIGEAEETWPSFLKDFTQGAPKCRYEQKQKTDMTKVPPPRFDLLRMHHYLSGSVQFSRGCPFQCEFCDIIVTFGRRPRLKTSAQVIAELEGLRGLGMREVFIVDDNLIGNKKAIKEVLKEVIAYQERLGYPFTFFTEASLDLAEDGELMRLMVEANIRTVFIGIESPNEEALKETRKFQNVRPVGSIAQRVRRVQDAGLEVTCGMIVGFDNDTLPIFEAQKRFLEEARIANAMVGMLAAIPKTPLHERLVREGRLDTNDVSEFGTNVIPLRMTREELRDGYLKMMREVSEPASYFQRVDSLYLEGKLPINRGLTRYWQRRPWHWLAFQVRCLMIAVLLFWRLMRLVPEAQLRRAYRRQVGRAILARPNPSLLLRYLGRCAMHYHAHSLVGQMRGMRDRVLNTY